MNKENGATPNKFDILDLRVLHFEKLVPLHNTSTQGTADAAESSKRKKETNGKNRIYKKFCSLGYYDQMSYVRAKSNDSILDYKHCFLIKYPYQEGNQRIMTDQMFTLIQECSSEKNQENNPDENDPFEADAATMPFLGIILITVGKIPITGQNNDELVQQEALTKIYQNIVAGYEEKSKNILDELKEKKDKKASNGSQTFCYNTFYTTNCADLCIAIRTNMLQDIYNIKEQIATMNLNDNTLKNVICHTTSYTLFQLPDSECWSKEELLERNKDIYIELRLSGSKEAIATIVNALPEGHSRVYGITGNGQISLELDFNAFVFAYPYIWKIKSGIETEPITFSNTNNDNNDALTDECMKKMIHAFCENASQLECSYIRVKYDPQIFQKDSENNCEETLSENAIKENNGAPTEKYDITLVKDYEDKVVNFPKNCDEYDILLQEHLKEQKNLLRELFYTYNDFWYRQSTWWKGIVFYAQLECIMQGVKQYEQLAHELPQEGDRSALIWRVCGDVGQAIFCVNNFNKLLQSVNQYILNIPNYEMQTKVNIEKYLMAYTMFLFEISYNYYRQHKKNGSKRILPFFVLDFNATRVEAHTLFDSISVLGEEENKADRDTLSDSITASEEKENKADGDTLSDSITASEEEGIKAAEDNNKASHHWTSLVAVRCPNYQWFANVYQVLPMITHEISHNLRYLDRDERNRTMVRLLIQHVSKYMMEQLVNKIEPGTACSYYREKEKFFQQCIEKTIQDAFPENDINLKNVRLKDLGNYFLNQLLTAIGLSTEDNQKSKLYDGLYKMMLKLFQIAKVPYFTPDDITEDFIQNNGQQADAILFNILLDLLKSNEKYEQWKEKIDRSYKNYEQQTGNMSSISSKYCKILTLLNNYEINNSIIMQYILNSLKDLTDIWTENVPEIQKLAEQNDNIKSYMNALKECKIRTAWEAIKEYVSSSKGKQEIKYLEEFHDFCQCYANIMNYSKLYKHGFPMERTTSKFAKKLYKKLHSKYQKALRKRTKSKNAWVQFNTNQKLLVSLGVTNNNPSQFVEIYKQAFWGTSEIQLGRMIRDHLRVYEELFADLGMCEAFQFSAFGYFMYCINIFMKERDVPVGKLKNLNADRVRILLLSKYKDTLERNNTKEQDTDEQNTDEQDTDEQNTTQDTEKQDTEEQDTKQALLVEDLKNYWNDFKEHVNDLTNNNQLQLDSKITEALNDITDFKSLIQKKKVIMDMIDSIKDAGQKEFLNQLEILRWMIIFYEDLELESERINLEKEDDLLVNDLKNCIENVMEKLKDEIWIQGCRENGILKEIGAYYNSYSYTNVLENNRKGICLDCQNKFVFEYYAKMFGCIQNVKTRLDNQKNPATEKKTELNILDCLFEHDLASKEDTAND